MASPSTTWCLNLFLIKGEEFILNPTPAPGLEGRGPSTPCLQIMAAAPVPCKEALTRLDAQLTCAICLNRYTDPRTLPCHHSFCKDCIVGLYGGETGERHVAVNCPTCRQPTQLGDRGASALPAAFHIIQFLEIDQLLKKTPASDPHPECPTHNKSLEIYCETCEELICFKCSIQTHRSHQYDLAADLFEKHKQQIEVCLQPVKERVDEVTQTLERFNAKEREIKDQGKAVQKEIDTTIQKLIDSLQKSRKTLSEKAASAVQQKLQLHSCQRAEVEAVLVQLKSCQEFIEKELRSRSQHQIQAAKKELVQRIRDTHSKVKVSELQPAQRADTEYVKNHIALSTCSNLGLIESTLNFSAPGLVSVDIPEHVMTGTRVEVSLTTPISLSTRLLSCQLIPAHSKPIPCPVSAVFEGQFKVTIHPIIAGPHQLRVQIAGADIYGSPFTLPVLSSAETRNMKMTGFFRGLESPCGIAVTADGKHVVVAEWNGNCVTVLTDTGELVRRFGSHGRGPAEFFSPWGIAISADNHILVADKGGIQKFTFTGHHVASVAYESMGFGLAVHQDGKIYSINRGAHKVHVLHPDLSPSHSFGSDDLFGCPGGVAIDTKGMVYVTDQFNCKVLKFTSEGEYLTSIGSEQPYQLSHAIGICIDSSDIMYVADAHKHQIMMFTTEGEFLGSFGNTGQWRLEPRGVAMDKTGNLYVCDFDGDVLISRA